MNLKGILLLILVSSLLIGTACAAGVNDFKIDDTYKSVYEGEYYSVHANDKQDVGICIYKNVDDDAYDDKENDDVLDNVIHMTERNTLLETMTCHSTRLMIKLQSSKTMNMQPTEHPK